MPQALTAFPQQLLSPLNLQPATGVEGLLGGRRARLNRALFHHYPRGCTREMFNMSIDNMGWAACISRVSALFAIINCFLFFFKAMSIHQIRLKSEYYNIMSAMCLDHMMRWLSGRYSDTVKTKEIAVSLFYKMPLKENLRAVWWLSSIHSTSFSELTLPVCSAALRLRHWSSMTPSASICCAAGYHNTIHFQASHHLIKLTCHSAQY